MKDASLCRKLLMSWSLAWNSSAQLRGPRRVRDLVEISDHREEHIQLDCASIKKLRFGAA